MAAREVVIGWDGQSNAIVRVQDDCGCEWTRDRKVRTNTCLACFREASRIIQGYMSSGRRAVKES